MAMIIITIIWGICLTYLVIVVVCELKKREKFILELELERVSKKIGCTIEETVKLRKVIDCLTRNQKKRLLKGEALTKEELEKLLLLVKAKDQEKRQ